MDYVIHLAILVSIYAILATSLNLVVGFTGLLSVTHAAFYGIGAYAVAILGMKIGLNFFLAVLVGLVASGILALLIGLVLSKFKGDFYALGSLGFNVIIFSIFLNWQDLTRGSLGIPGIERPEIFGFAFESNFSFLVLAVLFSFLVWLFLRFLTKSSFGRALKAIREDEEALSVFGYRTSTFKLAIFVIAAMAASIAGGLFASYLSYIGPNAFTINESIFILAIVILGGLASLRGSLLGALFLVLLPELLRFVGLPSDLAAQMRQAIYGLVLVLLMLYRPQGLVGEYKL